MRRDLALQEYRELVHKLDPAAVPPAIPTTSTSAFFTPSLVNPKPEDGSDTTACSSTLPPAASQTSPSETISNLLIGQRGVHQLFNDFSTTLTAKDRQIGSLQIHLESLEFSLSSLKDQLAAETQKRVDAEEEKNKAERDDKSAAMVVERYMTFTQKTHATVHMHLDNLRTRSNATITSLRGELATYKTRLADERERSNKLRDALDELSEGMSRESAGRRREVALRLKMIAQEEKRARKIESWLDHVRRMREGVDGVVLEADILNSLVDEGIEAVGEGGIEDVTPDKQRSWRGIVSSLRKKKKESLDDKGGERDPTEESLARTLLAEELVTTLVQDLQAETEKRMELERQRVEWLAKEAVEGAKVEDEGDGQIMFDLEDHTTPDIRPSEISEEKVEEVAAELEEDSPAEQQAPQPSHFVSELHTLFEPLTVRYTPLQKTLHDLSISLASLRASMSTSTPLTPAIRHGSKKSTFLPLARLPTPGSPLSKEMSTSATLSTLLDALHEVIEDARVDVEIARADNERVHRGFEALLNVIPGQGKDGEQKQVMEEVHEYVAAKSDGEEWKRLNRKIGDIEGDLAGLKRVLHEMEGMEVAQVDKDGEDDGNRNKKKGKDKEDKNIWHGIHLKTISLQPRQPSPLPTPLVSSFDDLTTQFPFSPNGSSTPDGAEPRRRTASMLSSVGNMSRSFSAGVMGAPRRVSGLASGLYRAPDKDRDERLKEGLLKGTDKIEEDDVE